MAFFKRRMGRELGTAFAVLAIYILTLLLPLHQAAGMQRDLGKLGFETQASWSICSPLAQDEQGDPETPAALKCPATGIAKQDLVAILPSAIMVGQLMVAPGRDLSPADPFHPVIPRHFGQSRAPPTAA